MSTIYGFPASAWQQAKSQMTELLVKRAKVRGMIPYSELVEQVQALHLDPHSYALSAMLGEIAAAEDEAGRGLLTVIVVHKHGDMQPGPGFFDIAKERGRDTSDLLKCWIDELRKVHAIWSVGK
jgi:molybdopterin synthase catalytic subunit